MDHRQRNKLFYEVIKHHKICVIPSNNIESFDKMPRFQIIENNLNVLKRVPGKHRRNRSTENQGDPAAAASSDQHDKLLKETEEKNKLLKQDPCMVKGSIELFSYINKLQTYKLKNVIQQSSSLQVKKKKRAGPLALEDFLGKAQKESVNDLDEEMKKQESKIFKTQDIKVDHSKLPDGY